MDPKDLKVSDAVRRLNPEVFGGTPHPTIPHDANGILRDGAKAMNFGGDKKRLRQSKGMNKTEAAFHEYLKAAFPNAWLYAQSFSLKLANGSNYRPDFVTVEPFTLAVTAWETKGFMREAAAVRIKVAASLYPWIKFVLVTKCKGGGWDFETVKP